MRDLPLWKNYLLIYLPREAFEWQEDGRGESKASLSRITHTFKHWVREGSIRFLKEDMDEVEWENPELKTGRCRLECVQLEAGFDSLLSK